MKNEINVGHYRVSVDTTGNEDKMIEKIKALWIKYEEIIAYLIVGGLTTVVSWAADRTVDRKSTRLNSSHVPECCIEYY